MFDRQAEKNNAEFTIELKGPCDESVLTPKDRSHYLDDEEWPLLGSHGAARRGRLTNREPAPPGATCKAGNDQRAGSHIVPLSVRTHQNEPGENMDTRSVVWEQSFRDRTRSSRPKTVLAAWLDQLTPSELQQGMEEMERTAGNVPPPTTQSKSIMIKAVNNIDNRGKTVWWEAIMLQVVGNGVNPYP